MPEKKKRKKNTASKIMESRFLKSYHSDRGIRLKKGSVRKKPGKAKVKVISPEYRVKRVLTGRRPQGAIKGKKLEELLPNVPGGKKKFMEALKEYQLRIEKERKKRKGKPPSPVLEYHKLLYSTEKA